MRIRPSKYQQKILIIGLLSSSLLLLQACSGGKSGITIDSNPQGADILADGKNIGKTPMQIKQDDVFPPHWYGRSYMVKGQLEMKMEGCEAVTMEVNDLVLSTDIKKDLSCKPGMMKAAVVKPPAKEVPVSKKIPASPAPAAVIPVAEKSKQEAKVGSPDSEFEARLSRLKDLRDRGVITASEYTEQRKRILESL